MPIYEYLCEACGRISEVMQKVTDPGPRSCPECGSRKVAKLVSRSAFQLKGGGWYADLYSSPKEDAGAARAGSQTPAAGENPPPAAGPDEKASPAAKPAQERRQAAARERSAADKKNAAK